MQREIEALLRRLEMDAARRGRIQTLLHEILFAAQVRDARLDEADQEFLGRVRRSVDEVADPAQYRQDQQWGPYNGRG